MKAKELRDEFWDDHACPSWGRLGTTATQNDYPEEVRMAWTDFLYFSHDAGNISAEVMDNTLLAPE
jgi:hypothetical protein